MLLYQILECTIHKAIQKSHTKAIDLKYQPQLETKNSNYLMDHIFYQTNKIIFAILSKTMKR